MGSGVYQMIGMSQLAYSTTHFETPLQLITIIATSSGDTEAKRPRSPFRPGRDYALLPLPTFGPGLGVAFLAAAAWARAGKLPLPVSPPDFA